MLLELRQAPLLRARITTWCCGPPSQVSVGGERGVVTASSSVNVSTPSARLLADSRIDVSAGGEVVLNTSSLKVPPLPPLYC